MHTTVSRSIAYISIEDGMNIESVVNRSEARITHLSLATISDSLSGTRRCQLTADRIPLGCEREDASSRFANHPGDFSSTRASPPRLPTNLYPTYLPTYRADDHPWLSFSVPPLHLAPRGLFEPDARRTICAHRPNASRHYANSFHWGLSPRYLRN